MDLPDLPCSFQDFPLRLHLAATQEAVNQIVEPFVSYESKLRQVYAQETGHEAVSSNHLVPVYQNGVSNLAIKARDLSAENPSEKDKYLLPLDEKGRRKNGSRATTTNLQDFKSNFNIFSEQSLSEMKWNNVVAAGSSVLTALLPVEAPYSDSKASLPRALRSYYHEQLAPASDVDLFIYGLDETEAIEKIKQIEASVRDSVISEVTVVRTKNAITIMSEYPVRHVQIVLRLYKSVSEILTGFDVDCACVAYDGTQVWAAPRALAALCTQVNNIDLTRRSPSYENRLSKYAHRGFEVYWRLLDRSRIDPTIFERSFNRVQGLARLLVLEKLPHPQDRDEYLQKRRKERGRPDLPWNAHLTKSLPGNVKEVQPDDVPEWQEEDQASNYHTFTLPWGPRYTPKKVERLLYSKDLLLNAEWNKRLDRKTSLHRHPAFFGRVEDVIQDCCGYCPEPITDEDLAAWEEESKIYVSGNVTFLKDNPGRQAIGSFHPLTDDDWTTMAYIGNTTKLCQAIVAQDLDGVIEWFESGEADVNRRDHTGRSPLQLAVMCSSEDIVQYLIGRGARITARLYNGFTALHLAAHRGNAVMVSALLDKSLENEIEEDVKEDTRREARRLAASGNTETRSMVDEIDNSKGEDVGENETESNSDFLGSEDFDSEADDVTEGSFVKVKAKPEKDLDFQDDPEGPDVYDVSVVAWDAPISPLHLAIMAGHIDIIRLLVDEYDADVLLPVKIMTDTLPRKPQAAILTLLLPMALPRQRARDTVKVLLEKGASPLQADMEKLTALQFTVANGKLGILHDFEAFCGGAFSKTLNRLVVQGKYYLEVDSLLLSAIRSESLEMIDEILSQAENVSIDFDVFARDCDETIGKSCNDPEEAKKFYLRTVEQPIILASRQEGTADVVLKLLEKGADVNSISPQSWEKVEKSATYLDGKSVLDFIRNRRIKLEEYANNELENSLQRPKPLESDDFYLGKFKKGTYKYFSASGDLERAKIIQAKGLRQFQNDSEMAKAEASHPAVRAKKAAAAKMAQKLRGVENSLKEKGAKSFAEMYPHLEKSESTRRSLNVEGETTGAYETTFQFEDLGISPKDRSRYVQLFEAAFTGDEQTLRDLCLTKNKSVSPLRISVNDSNGFNCFNLAVLQGHYNLAITVLDIAAAQYEYLHGALSIKYSMKPATRNEEESSDDEDEQDEDRPLNFYAQLIDDKFTFDDIFDLSEDVKSKVEPLHMLNKTCDLSRMMDMTRDEACHRLRINPKVDEWARSYQRGRLSPLAKFKFDIAENKKHSGASLWRYAVVTNNLELFQFLLQMERKHSFAPIDELLEDFKDQTSELQIAMEEGHVTILSEIISQRGTLLPLDQLAESSGSVIDQKPKYYQGLSVRGKKRKDWVKQDQGVFSIPKDEEGSPLLTAIMHGNSEVVKYFTSNEPAQKYQTFAETYSTDQRVQSLSAGSGGLSTAIESWMSIRTTLVLHVAVMAQPSTTITHLEYLLKKFPKGCLEVRSSSGHTPLHLALKLRNYPAFETLLAARANQRTKDRTGQNLLHTIYTTARVDQVEVFKKIVGMLDKDVVQDLLLEKCSSMGPGFLTPLALHLYQKASDTEGDLKLLDAMLDLSGGKDLTVIDGAGDYPLHVETRQDRILRAKHLAKRRPDLLYLENATGMTPIEVAQTAYFQYCVNHVPKVSVRANEKGLLDMPAENFLPDTENTGHANNEENLDLPTVYPMYAGLVQIGRKNPQPRQLVSVLDSNEVARRLASQQHRKNIENRKRQAQGLKGWNRFYYADYHDRNRDEELETDGQGKKIVDEVAKWHKTAAERIESVPWHVHLPDTADAVEAAFQKWQDFASGKLANFECCDMDGVIHHARDEREKKSRELTLRDAWPKLRNARNNLG